jgi:diguanylate cyclase (GGDEF)-like protein
VGVVSLPQAAGAAVLEPLVTFLDDLWGRLGSLLDKESCVRAVPLVAAVAAALLARPALPDAWLAAWLATLVVLTALRLTGAVPGSLAALQGLAWGLAAATLLGEQGSAPTGGCLLALAAAALWDALTPGTTTGRQATFLTALAAPPLLVLAAVWSPTLLPMLMLGGLCLAGSLALALQHDARDSARTARDAALQLTLNARESELGRLRLEFGAAIEARSRVEEALASASSELTVLRAKTASLSSLLQRVNPYDIETGLLNEEKFAAEFNREWARMQRQELPLSLLLISVDGFEAFRDWHGKAAFEAALRRLGDAFRHAGHRPGDLAARLQDNLFAVLFPETDLRHVGALADAIRHRVRELGIPAAPTETHRTLTVTIGMATVIPNSELSPTQLRERVEAALYEAQFQGGDRCVRYRSLEQLRVQPWNPRADGELGVEALRNKLAVLGFAAEPRALRPGETVPARRQAAESAVAVAIGRLAVLLEGDARTLRPGDVMFVPKGVALAMEAAGTRPVICFDATPAEASSGPALAQAAADRLSVDRETARMPAMNAVPGGRDR